MAFIPLGLSCWYFQMTDLPRTSRWWLGIFIFILFLPNAPCILTDIVYLIQAIRFTEDSVWLITLVLMPQFFIYICAGFFAYVFCLLNVGSYLQQYRLHRWIPAMELGAHLLSAIGIFLGRFVQLSSWDAFSRPAQVAESAVGSVFLAWSLVVIGITFVVLTVLYGIGKQAVLGWLREYPMSASPMAHSLLPPANGNEGRA